MQPSLSKRLACDKSQTRTLPCPSLFKSPVAMAVTLRPRSDARCARGLRSNFAGYADCRFEALSMQREHTERRTHVHLTRSYMLGPGSSATPVGNENFASAYV